MSRILDLAKTFEETSKVEAESMNKRVKAALKQHESSLNEELKLSEMRLKRAIEQHVNETKGALKSTLMVSATVWITGLVVAGAIILGMSWWSAGMTIKILEQRATLAGLEANTGGAVLKMTSEGPYLMLPKGADTTIYRMANGHPAVKLGK